MRWASGRGLCSMAESGQLEHVRWALCGADEPRSILRADELSLRDRSRLHWSIVQCRKCGLVYVNPRLGAKSASEIYAGETYGFVRSHLADAFVDGRPHATRLLDELESLGVDGNILDVGCATGDVLLAAQERGWETHGVELSPHAAAVAGRRGFNVMVGTLADARFPAGSFDVLTILDVIEHLPDPVAELGEINRVLRPGGLVVVETPNWNSIYRYLLRQRWAALQPRLHILYFNRRTLSRLLERAGFEVMRSTTEIVALFSPEAAARGLGPALLRGIGRDVVVRWLLSRPPGPLDRLFLRIGPAGRIGSANGSFKGMSDSAEGANGAAVPLRRSRLTALVRWLNRPTDRLFLKLGMGEQLRVYGRRR